MTDSKVTHFELSTKEQHLAFALGSLNFTCSPSEFFGRASKKYSLWDYLSEWYLPLVKHGFTVPFFVVLDLGLMFCSGGYFRIVPYQRTFLDERVRSLQARYNMFFVKLTRDPLGKMCRELPVAPFSMQRFEATLTFLEFFLVVFEHPSFEVVVEPELLRGTRPELPQSERIYTCLRDTRNIFEGSRIAPAIIRSTNDLNAAYLERRFSKPEEIRLQNSQSFEQILYADCLTARDYHDLDLLLLSNYSRCFKLSWEREFQQKVQRIERTSSLQIESQHRSTGERYGISQRGKLSSILPHEWGTKNVSNALFFYKYYNHLLLYYEHLIFRNRPRAILVVVFVEVSLPMHFAKVSPSYSKSMLARELAAYLVEDTGRYIGMLDGIHLTFGIVPVAEYSEWQPYFFSFSDEHRAQVSKQQPFLHHEHRFLADFFRLETVASLSNQTQDFDGCMEDSVQMAKQQLRVLSHNHPDPDGVYDSAHFVFMTDAAREHNGDWFTWRGFARRVVLHRYAFDELDVKWRASVTSSIDWQLGTATESYKEMGNRQQHIRQSFINLALSEILKIS